MCVCVLIFYFSCSALLRLDVYQYIIFIFQLLVGDIEVVSANQYTATTSGTYNDRYTKVNQLSSQTAQPIQVDENDPILNKATKLDHLCTGDRDYYLLESDATTAEEYAKLSLGSESTINDSHVNHLSLAQCDDSLSTTVSEESEFCTAAVRVYDLNKRETKILRHDIIKRSRNPVGGDSHNLIDSSFGNFDNCCNDKSKNSAKSICSPLNTTIQQFNSHILENANEPRKPPRSPTKLKSVHLNRNPRKLKMSDVQQVNEAFGTSLDATIVDELKNELKARESLATATENLLTSERKSSSINDDSANASIYETITVNENNGHVIDDVNNDNNNNDSNRSSNNQDVNENVANDNVDATQINNAAQTANESITTIITTTTTSSEDGITGAPSLVQRDNGIDETDEIVTELTTTTISATTSSITTKTTAIITTNYDIEQNHVSAEAVDAAAESQTIEHVQYRNEKIERHNDIVVSVKELTEKSVIEEDVISVLPSVKALAQTFSMQKEEAVTPKLNRPKVRKQHKYISFRSID